MIKAILIDDEELACDLLEEYLQAFRQIEVVARCHDGFAAVKAVQEQQPDLLFLDVQMPKLSGFEVLQLLDNPPAVIFTTAFDQYAVQAFENQAVDYLLKPFSQERFAQAVQRYLDLSPAEKEKTQERQAALAAPAMGAQRLVLRRGAQVHLLPFARILYLQADGDYVHLFTQEGKFTQKKALQHYESLLPRDVFVRLHRSYLVNIAHIEKVEPYGKNTHLARIKSGEQIPVSRSGYQRLKGYWES